jgi:hypothetical protein
VAVTVSEPVPIVIVLEPVVGRTIVPKAKALSWAIVTGWMIVVVPVVVAELLDWAKAGVARPESISRAVAVFVTSFMFFSSKISAASHRGRLS